MKVKVLLCSLAIGVSTLITGAQTVDAALQAKIDSKLTEIKSWAADTVIVSAVKAHNSSLPSDHAAMTQDKWKTLTVLDPFVRSFTKNPAAEFLKGKKGDIVNEAFLSDAAGLKVAFLNKSSGWSHKGNPKHENPMSGKTWQGAVEVDESTGLQQIQVSVPVLDGDKPIGSLVVGLSVSKLAK